MRLLFLVMVAACAVDPPTAMSSQGLQVVCGYDDNDNPIYCEWGGNGGGGTPQVNTCPQFINCDPVFGWTADLNCVTSCNDLSARCNASYTCPAGTDLPLCHLGYCANWH